jgi:hypothetical protein
MCWLVARLVGDHSMFKGIWALWDTVYVCALL